MKSRIDLDFTSLLDIFMVLIFFFIIFSKFETDELKENYNIMQDHINEQYQEIGDMRTEVQYKSNEADRKYEEAQQALDIAESAVEHSGDNAQAITDMIQGKNIKLFLVMGNAKNEWYIKTIKENELLSEIQYASVDRLCEELEKILEENEYEKNRTLIIDFLYDGEQNGTTSAYSKMKKVFDKLKKEYAQLYVSETDMSLAN